MASDTFASTGNAKASGSTNGMLIKPTTTPATLVASGFSKEYADKWLDTAKTAGYANIYDYQKSVAATADRAGAAGMTQAQYDAYVVQQSFTKSEAARAEALKPTSQAVVTATPAVDAKAGILGGTAAKTFQAANTAGGIATGAPAVSGGGKTFGTTAKKKMDELGASAGFLLGA